MTQINIIGNILGMSGYDSHTRNLANALDKITKVRLSTQLIPNWERMVSDRELEMIKRKPEEDEINLIITNPIYWKVNCGKRNFAYLVWEGDKVPKSFIEYCLNPDIEKIIVPSNHTREAIMNTWMDWLNDNQIAKENPDYRETRELMKTAKVDLLRDKIVIIHHGVNLDLFYPKEKPKRVTFLCNKGWRHNQDRGGMQYAVKAYLEEFTDKDDIELILKINPAYGIPPVQVLMEQLTNKRENLPKVTVDINGYEYKDLVKLYNRANVLIAPSRAEAFGIPMLEGLACGLPCITSSFGGQTDFVNNENGWLIDGKLEEVKWELQYEGIKWLTPNIIELRKVMREIYTNPEITRLKGDVGLKTASKMTWDETARKIKELI